MKFNPNLFSFRTMFNIIKDKKWVEVSQIFIFGIMLITPIIDLLNGILREISFSPGQIIRSIILLFAYVLTYFFSRRDFIYLNILLGVLGLILLIHVFVFNEPIAGQIIWNARIMYTLILIVYFRSVFPKLSKLFRNNLLVYLEYAVSFISIVILLSALSNTGFSTYENGSGVGYKGFFLGQNDITAVISMIFPILLYRLISIRKNRVIRIINVTVVLFAAVLLGTKSGLAFIILSILGVGCLVISQKKHLNFFKQRKKYFIYSAVSFVLVTTTFLFFVRESLLKWLDFQLFFLNKSNSFLTFILSGRNKSIQPMLEVLWENPIFFFIGSTFNKGQKLIGNKLGYHAFIEFDPISILYYNGILVFLLYFYVFFQLFKYIPYLIKCNIETKVILISFGIGFLYSSLGGHVLPSGIAGTYFAVLFGLIKINGEQVERKSNG